MYQTLKAHDKLHTYKTVLSFSKVLGNVNCSLHVTHAQVASLGKGRCTCSPETIETPHTTGY